MNLFKYCISFIVKKLRKPAKVEPVKVMEPIETPENQIKQEDLLTVTEAAKKNGLTRQAIYLAIKLDRLKATRVEGVLKVANTELNEYFDTKYKRSNSKKDGELIFDKSKGYYSVTEAAKFLNTNNNQVYYLVRMGRITSHRKGTAIVIHESELQKHLEFVSKKCKSTQSA